MATYSTNVKRSTIYQWILPAEFPYGTNKAEFGKALAAACHAYRAAQGWPDDHSIPDDAFQILPSDDQIIIQFEVFERPS